MLLSQKNLVVLENMQFTYNLDKYITHSLRDYSTSTIYMYYIGDID